MKNTRKFVTCMSALALTLGLVGCGENGGSTKKDDTINVAIIAPTTGGVAEYGLAVSNGAKMALDEIKEINGHKIVYTIYDTKGEDETAIANFETAVAAGADFVLGGVISSESTAIGQKSQSMGANKVTILSGSATAEAFTKTGDNVFRACFTDPQQGEKLAKFVYDDLGKKNVAVLYNADSDYSKGCAEAFRDTLTGKGGSVSSFESYAQTEANFTVVVSKILKTNPDTIYLPDYYEKVSALIKEIRKQNFKGSIVGADGWDSVNTYFDSSNYSYLEDCYFSNSFYENTPVSQEFIKAYQTEYGTKPISFCALGYDIGYIMAAAFEEAYKTTSNPIPTHKELTDAMYKISITGVTGTISFNSEGNPTNAGCILTFNTTTGATEFVK